MLVDHLAERSLPTTKVRGLISVIGKFLCSIYFNAVKCIEKKKINKKMPRMVHKKF